MIFLTVGTQKFQFNRLLMAVDYAVKTKKIQEPVFAQTGASDYLPKYYEYKKFLSEEEIRGKRKEATVILTHGGTGSIIEALKLAKPVVAIPRSSKYKEHVDDHQKEIVEEMEKEGLLVAAKDLSDLPLYIDQALHMPRIPYQGNNQELISYISSILKG